MMMARLLKAALIGAFAAIAPGTVALAADLPEPPVYVPPPPVYGGWYLRGHIGMSNQDFDGLEYAAFSNPAYFEWLNEGEFDAGVIFGGGIGYRFTDWFRVDVTGEYRGKTDFSALDRYDTDGLDLFEDSDWGTNEYDGKKSEWLFLANAYFDLGTWYSITPYVGAGIGASYNTISGFRDTNVITGGGGYAGSASQWNLAWALHAGFSYQATQNLFVDFGYSFVDLGNAQTGTFYNDSGSCSSCTSVKFTDIYSHDLKLGFRWEFGGNDYNEPAMVKY